MWQTWLAVKCYQILSLPIRQIISTNISKLTGRCQTRKTSIALQPNSRNSASSLLTYSRFDNQIWRFWFYQILGRRNNENIIAHTFCCFLPTARSSFICCAWRWGGACRAEAEIWRQNKPEKNRNLAVSWQPFDLFIAVSWKSEVCFFGLQKWVVLSCFLYFCAVKFAFCATVAFKVFFLDIMWTGRVVVRTWKRRQILKATSQKIKAKV